jgi:hypothetical protein
MHPRFAAELRRLARRDIGNAEAHRLLIPLAARTHSERPSYWRVRRFMIAERAKLERSRREWERFERQVIVPMLSGGSPRLD